MNHIVKITNEAFKLRSVCGAADAQPLFSLKAARNQISSFQIILETGKNMKVSVGNHNSLSNFMPMDRYRVEVESPIEGIKTYLEGYLPDENNIMCSDILLTDPSCEYKGDMPAVIWVDIPVSSEEKSGEYEVKVKVFYSKGIMKEELVDTKSIVIEVDDYVLPDVRDYNLYVDIWQQNSNISRTYGVDLWSDEHFEIMEKVIASLAGLGQKSVTIVASDCPWRGWGCHLLRNTPANLYEYSMIPVIKDKGIFHYDFSIMQRYIDLCDSYGINGDISIYGLIGLWTIPYFTVPEISNYPEKLLVRYKDKTDDCYSYMNKKEDILGYMKALFDYFASTNQLFKVRIAADEPKNLEGFRESLNLIRSVAPNVKFKMALDHATVIRDFTYEIEDVASSFPCTCSENEFLLLHKKEYKKRLLWYVCNIPYDKPNTVLHNHLLDTRVLGALNYIFGFDGFLRWAYTCWPNDPGNDIRFNDMGLPAGDVNFIYPTRNADVALSLRYKALQRGFEDYELMYRLKEKGKEDVVRAALDKIIYNYDFKKYMQTDRVTHDNIYSVSYEDYSAMREILIKGLME